MLDRFLLSVFFLLFFVEIAGLEQLRETLAREIYMVIGLCANMSGERHV